MTNIDNKKKLFDALSEDYDMGTFEVFANDVNDDVKRRKLYDAISNEYDLGDFETFSAQLLGITPAPQNTFTSEQLGLQEESDESADGMITTERQVSMTTPMWGTLSVGENRREAVKDLGSASSGQGGISEYIEMISGVKSEGQEKAEEQMRIAKERAARGERNWHPYGDTKKPIESPDIRIGAADNVGLGSPSFNADIYADEAVRRAEEGLKPADGWTEATKRAQANIANKNRQAQIKKAAEDAVGEQRERLTVISDRLADADAKRPPVVVGNPTTMGGVLTKQRAFEKDYRELRAADNLLSQTEKMVETFNAGKEMGGWANLGRSMATTVFDPTTWDFGFSDANVAERLLSVVEKANKGEKLSESEQLLLDAAINHQVMQGYYSELSGWQKAGQMFGESLPFMAQMAINPMASLGKYASSKAAKAVVKHIAKKVGEKGIKKILAKTAGITGRALGDLAGSYGMALTSNLGNTTADALNRQIGDIQYDFDDNGIARYNGRLNVKEAGEAWLDAINNQAFEFYSEKMGEYFAPIFKGMGKLGGKVLDNFGMEGVNRWISDFAKKGSVRQLNQFFEKTQFHGFASEYAEEIANGMLNAAFVGDMTMEDVFSKDNLIDTAIGLSVMGAIGPMVGTAGYARAKYKEKQALNEADEEGRRLKGHAWDYFADAVRRSKNGEELSANLRETLNSFGRKALPGEDMRQILSYAQAYNRYKAVEEVSAAAVAEGVMDERDLELQRQYESGQTTTDKHGLRLTYEAAADAVKDVIPLNIGENTAYDIADKYDEQGDADTATAIRVFLSARAAHSGMTAQIREQAQSELESANAEIDSHTNKTDGNIYSVTLGGGLNGYVTGGTVITDSDGDIDIDATREANEGGYIYVNVDGVVKPKSVDDFVSLDGVVSAADAKAAREAEINAALNAQYEELTAPVETQEAAPTSTEVTPESAAPAAAPVNNAPTVSEVAENAARALGVLPEELEEVILDEQEGLELGARYNNIGDTDSANAIRAYVAERFGTPAVQPAQVNNATAAEVGNNGGENILENGNNGAENIPALEGVAPIPVEKRGKEERQAFHLVPVERTTEELYNSGLDQQEIDAFVQANIDEINSDIEKHSKKQPKMGANIAAYKAAKEEWQAQNEDLAARLNYYKTLQGHIKGITTSNTAEAINAPIADVSDITTPEEFIAAQLGGIKITPESFRKETGLSATEQKALVGVIAGKDKGGVSIERAAEIITDNYSEELAGLGFKGDMMDVRNAIIDILSGGNPKTYAKRAAEARQMQVVDERRDQMDYIARQLGFDSVDEMIAHEETILPRIIEQYAGFDEQTYYTILVNDYNNDYDTTRESETVGRGGEVLQDEQPTNASGTEPVGTGQQGGAATSSVQSNGANVATPGNQEVSEPVRNSEQLNQSGENTEMGAEGDAPGQSGVYSLSELRDNEGNRFYQKNGSIDLWDLSPLFEQARRQNAPIRLTERNVNHILDEHKKELGDSEESVLKFLDDVFSTARILRKARSAGIFVVVENTKTDKAAIIRLYPSKHGDYYNVESAGYYRKNKWKDTENVIAELSEPTQSVTASDVSKPQVPEEGGRELLNAETATTSADESTASVSNSQENSVKSGENTQNEGEISQEIEDNSTTGGESGSSEIPNNSTISQESEQVSDQVEKKAKAKKGAEKIEDVGEKIGGAKKDKLRETIDRMKTDIQQSDETLIDKIANLPISKIFNFDFQKLREGGMPNDAISFMEIVRKSIPAKPRTSHKVRRWVNNTLALYKLCLEVGTNWDKVNTVLSSRDFAGTDLKAQYDAYMSVGGFDSGLNIGNAKLKQLDKTAGYYKDGKFISSEGKWYVRDAGKHSGIYDTKEDAVEALKAFAGDNAGTTESGKKKEVKFAVYQRREDKSIFIAIKGKSDIVIQDGFKSAKEAFDYIGANNAELQSRYRNLLDKTNADFEENRERKGRDYRNGKDVSAEEFRSTFGFRGVEFGNWMAQEDRKKAINECYDALMDLAEVCKVSPRALSLDGTLAMAFGARGGGKFSAHYEPGKVVINMTKTRGAGSLAHEWFHALDNYFAKMGKDDIGIYATAGEGMLPEGFQKIGDKFYDKNSHRMLTAEEAQAKIDAHKVRAEMASAWNYLMNKLKKSDYYKRSNAYARLHNSKYWNNPTELGARAFSIWVENELSKQDISNDYLANNPRYIKSEVTDAQDKYMPYPFDTDADWMDEAFGNLFEVMQEKVTEKSNIALYQRGSLSLDGENPAFRAATEKTMQALENTGVEVVMATEEQVNAMMGADFSRAAAPFYSNARKAVLDIKQEKATPEQWVAMLKKNGGLKAGEDAWVGLEAWLNNQQGTVTKQEILDYLTENSILIEEVEYAEDGEIKTYEELPARSTKVEDWRHYGREQGYVTEFWAADVLGGVNGKVFITRNSLKADGREVFVPKINSRYLQQLDEDFPVYYDTFEDAVDGLNEFFDKHRQRKVNKRTVKAANDTRLDYTTEGLNNKREIALTVPTIEPYNQSDEVHFGDAGGGRVVAWVRFGETTDSEGNRVLVIDEIQSKRHQDGREKGYRSNADKFLKDNGIEVVETDTHIEFYKNGEIDKRFAKALFNTDIEKAKNLYVAGYEKTAIPSAPFEKNWHELAMKRMLRLAAEEGFDKVAWTTGEQQAERYDMSRQVESISVEENTTEEFSDGTPVAKNIIISTANGLNIYIDTDAEGVIHGGEYGGKRLSDVVGKEIAEKIMQPGDFKLEGEGLRIGGEGMKGFYDKMLPSFVQKYTKKWGAKVGEVTMPGLKENNTMHSVDVTPEMRESVMQGQPMFHRVYHGSGAKFDRFDHSFMGTGEGAQAFGWGTYVTEVEGIGKSYAENAVNSSAEEDIVDIRRHFRYNPLGIDVDTVEDAKRYLANLIKDFEGTEEWDSVIEEIEELRELTVKWERLEDEKRRTRKLYTVEIPDDNGSNYLYWEKPVNGEIQERVANGLQSIGFEFEPEMNHLAYSRDGKMAVLNINAKGKDLYAELSDALGGDKAASQFLNDLGFVGISYPAEAMTGGREDGARNYVIFNENDAQITDRVEFLRTANGTVYGWTVNGRIYLTPDGINPNTPVHEYTHLWASAIEQNDPKLWSKIVEAMKQSPVWNEVMADEAYRDIWNDENRVASEVLSRLSGNENYRRTMQEAAERENDPTKKFGLIAALGRVKRALADFWNAIKGLFGADNATPWEQFVNSAIGDFYKGVNPNVQNSSMERMTMGSRVDARMAQVASELEGRVLTTEQQAVADVFGGKADNLTINVKTKDGNERKVVMRQGNEANAGAKHSLYRHFGTGVGVITSDDIISIPSIITNGVRTEKRRGSTRLAEYKLTDVNGGEFTVLTEIKKGKEIFNDFYSNKKAPLSGTFNTQSAHTANNNALSADKGSDNSSNSQENDDIRFRSVGGNSGYVSKNVNYIVSLFNRENAGAAPCVVIKSIDTLEAQLKELGFSDQSIKGSMESFKEGCLAEYNPNEDYVVIYDSNASENKIIGYLWHENAHKEIGKVYTQEEIDNAFNFYFKNNIDKVYESLENYPKSSVPEEALIRAFEEDYQHALDVIDGNDTESREKRMSFIEFFRPIVNNIRYGERENTTGEQQGAKSVRPDNVGELEVRNSETQRETERREERIQKVNSEIISAVNKLAAELHTDVEIVNEVSAIPDARKRGSKGWYDGRVYLVLPNATSVDDAVKTILHEVVGHKGLRALFGEGFNDMLADVFKNAPKQIRKAILDRALNMMAEGRKDFLHVATEEYLAEQAERGFDDYSFLDKAKGWILKLLRSIGLKSKISDSEIRYMLWRSYNLLKGNNTLAEIENIAMQARLGVGEYRARGEVIDANHRDTSNAQEQYNKNVEGFTDRAKEAWIDKTRSVKKMQEAIEKETGNKIADYANVYLLMNQMPGRVREKMDKFLKKHLDPLGEFLKKMFKNDYLKGSEEQKQKQVERYLNCKHGIERNIDMSVRAALTNEEGVLDRKTYEQYTTEKEAIWEKNLPWAEEVKELTELSKKYNAKEKDYSGLTALFPGEDSYNKIRSKAIKRVEDFENAFDKKVIDELWKRVGDINELTLKESYKSGLLSNDLYGSIKRQFKYYVPLRGFEETTADEVYEYLSREDVPISGPIRRAEGRKSEAEKIFATMANMYNSAVSMGAKNRIKQALFQMAVMNKTSLLSVNPSYYKEDGRGGYEPFLPSITDNMSEDEIREEMEKYEEDVKKGLKDGTIKRHREGLNIDYKSEKWQRDEHAVRVKRNGKEFVIFVNGSPRVAQAVNGLLDKRGGKFIQTLQAANRWRARNITGYNVNFTLSNLARDIQEASITAFAKEGVAYAWKFEKELMKNLAAFRAEDGVKYRGIHNLYYRYFKDELDLTDKREKYFKEFMENGGETGFHSMMSIEDYQKRIKKAVDSNLLNATGKGFAAINDTVEFVNRGIENACRFATYVASRESGKSIMQSVNDAKEASVNFNRVGSGAMGNLYFRASKMFLNPAIQGLVKRLTLMRDYPARMVPIVAMELLTGYIVGDLAMMAMKFIWDALGFDDDDEENNAYYNLSDFVRRSNVIIPLVDGKFIKIPLSHESRVAHGIGEILSSYMNGHLEYENIPAQVYSVLTQAIPLNPTAPDSFTDENLLEDIAKVLIPDAFALPAYEALALNRDFTGRRITGRSDYNEHRPEYMRAGKGTPEFFIEMSRTINDWTGGSDIERGVLENAVGGVNNPTFYEYMLIANLGGIATMTAQLYKTAQALKGDEEYQEARNYPVINRFFEDTSSYEEEPQERTRRDYERAYRFFKEKVKDYSDVLNNYKAAENMGIDGLEDELEDIKGEKMEEKRDAFKPYKQDLDELYDDLNEAKDKKDQSKITEIEKDILEKKIEAVKEMEKEFSWE